MHVPEQLRLRAGPVSARLEDSELRDVRVGDVEVIRRLHGAVRDAAWGTVPGRVVSRTVDRTADSFAVVCRCSHAAGEIAFDWTASITGATDGTIVFDFDGVARSTFRRNRIGLCVLHPLREWAGACVEVRTTRGDTRRAQLPILVAREQPIAGCHDIDVMSARLAGDVRVTLAFEGETFETEDQRNWIDASFKTYGTPLSLPRPVLVEAGTRVWQRITLRVEGTAAAPPLRRPKDRLTLPAPEAPHHVCPAIGVGLALADLTCTPALVGSLLERLAPGYVRVAIPAAAAADAAATSRALAACERLPGQPAVELVMEVPEDEGQADTLLAAVAGGWPRGVRCARVLVVEHGRSTTTPRALAAGRRLAARLDPRVPLFSGSHADLYELHLHPVPAADGLVWGMNPQVHAVDLASISETPPAAGAQVRAMAHRWPGQPLAISPVTLERRGHPSPALRDHPFAAAWTLGVLSHLLHPAVGSVTFYDRVAQWTSAFATGHDREHPPALAPGASMIADVWAVARDGRVLPLPAVDDTLATLLVAGPAGATLWLANLSLRHSLRVDVSGVLVPRDGLPVRTLTPGAWLRMAGPSAATR